MVVHGAGAFVLQPALLHHEMTLVFSGVQLPNTTYDAFYLRLMKLKLRNTVR